MSAGKDRLRDFLIRPYRRLGFGSVQGAVRWKTVTRAARPAMAGTSWMALAPVPMTPTRRPSTSSAGSQPAVCVAGPAKSAAPGIAGTTGRDSWPVAGTSTSNSAWPTSPVAASASVSRHAAPVQVASVTAVPSRRCGRRPRSRTQRRR
jgi:hypothetical protein